MVKVNFKHLPFPEAEPARKKGKVINLMDALRQSVHNNKSARVVRASAAPVSAGELSLVRPWKSTKRRSA